MFRPLLFVTIALFGCSLIGCSRRNDNPRQLVDAQRQKQVEAIGQEIQQNLESLYWQNEEAKSGEVKYDVRSALNFGPIGNPIGHRWAPSVEGDLRFSIQIERAMMGQGRIAPPEVDLQ